MKRSNNCIFVGFGRFIVQRLQALWFRVHFNYRAFWIATQEVAKRSRVVTSPHRRGIGDRSKLHFRYGAGKKECLSPDHGSFGSRLRNILIAISPRARPQTARILLVFSFAAARGWINARFHRVYHALERVEAAVDLSGATSIRIFEIRPI